MTRPRKYTCDHTFFSTIDTEEKAYWLGFTYADGCVTTTNNKLSVQYWLSSKDKCHLEKLNNSIKGNYPINIYRTMGGYSNTNNQRCNLSIKYEEMAKDLVALGCTQNKSLTLKFPSIEKNLIRHFIRGYFDGDGSLFWNNYKNQGKQYKRIGFHLCGTLEFLTEITNYIKYPQAIYKEKRRSTNTYTYKIFGAKRVKPIIKYLYEDSTIYLDRKYKLAMELLNV